MILKFACGRLRTVFGKSLRFQVLLFCFEGKCVAGGSVVVAVSLS